MKLDELPDDAEVSQFADQMLISLRTEWRGHQGGSLLAAGMEEVLTCGPAAAGLTALFTPTERCSLEYWVVTRDLLVLVMLDNVKSRLKYWRKTEGAEG